jgi:hypothetical protein
VIGISARVPSGEGMAVAPSPPIVGSATGFSVVPGAGGSETPVFASVDAGVGSATGEPVPSPPVDASVGSIDASDSGESDGAEIGGPLGTSATGSLVGSFVAPAGARAGCSETSVEGTIDSCWPSTKVGEGVGPLPFEDLRDS